MSNKAEYDLMEPFGIDEGELDGLSPQMCFVLGYEICQCHQLADTGREWSKPIHEANVYRVEALLRRRGLAFKHKRLNEEWRQFEVEAM